MYAVPGFTSTSVTFNLVLRKLKEERLAILRLIIYRPRYDDCSKLYKYFRNELGEGFMEPMDAPDHSRFRLAEVYQR